MADGNPFASVVNPNMRQTSLWDLRMMSAANRMETPFERGARSSYGHPIAQGTMLGNLGAMANEPDYSAFTYDPQMHAQAVAAGVHPLEATQVQPNVLLPNTGYFGNHPRLAGALEAGLFGAAAAHGGMTPGESIQGTIEGMIGGKRLREGLYNQQFARPFEAAGMMEGLRDLQQRRELQAAQIKHYQSEADIQADRVDSERQKLDLTRYSVTPVEGGTYIGEPGKEPVFHPGPGKTNRQTNLDIGTREQLMVMGVDPEKATPTQIQKANAANQAQKIALAGATAGAGSIARIPAQNYTAARTEYEGRRARMEDQYNKYISKDAQTIQQNRKEIQDAYTQDWVSQSLAAQGNHQKAPPLRLPTTGEIDAEISQRAALLKQNMDQEEQDFNTKWPQSLEAPPTKKGSSQRTGSAAQTKGTKNDPHILVAPH